MHHWRHNAELIPVGERSINVPWLDEAFHRPSKGRYSSTDTIYEFNMKLLVCISLSCLVAIAWCKPSATYTDKWDHINVDEILESDRLLNAYRDCMLDKGRCTPDAKALKETLPDALEHDCSKCTAKQKSSSEKVIKFLVNKRPDIWEELSHKYDPKNIYQEKYKDKLESVKGSA